MGYYGYMTRGEYEEDSRIKENGQRCCNRKVRMKRVVRVSGRLKKNVTRLLHLIGVVEQPGLIIRRKVTETSPRGCQAIENSTSRSPTKGNSRAENGSHDL